MYLQVKFVYEGHRGKVTVTRAKTLNVIPPPLHSSVSYECYPATPILKWEHWMLSRHSYTEVRAWLQLPRQWAHCATEGQHWNITMGNSMRQVCRIIQIRTLRQRRTMNIHWLTVC